jgi:hypothetical protein
MSKRQMGKGQVRIASTLPFANLPFANFKEILED